MAESVVSLWAVFHRTLLGNHKEFVTLVQLPAGQAPQNMTGRYSAVEIPLVSLLANMEADHG